ncbi:MAG: hypothetical protein JWN45_1557 [Acidobacteriaceae bacterium]|nr:hypothetical protein [Acidobacteriaceae bacterium]
MSQSATFRKPVPYIASALLIVSMTIATLTAQRLDEMRPQATLMEVIYIQSPRAVKVMSLGYTGLAACVYWTRAVQYFGEKHLLRSKRLDLLPKLLDLTVSLDPHLLPAYEFGAIFLAQKPPEGAGLPDEAVKLVERGIRANPDRWKLYYSLGFIHFIERKDYKAAEKAFDEGSKIPGAHPWMKVMAAAMAARAGDMDSARFLWTQIYEGTDDKLIRRNALSRLIALRVDDDVIHLDKMVQDYVKKTGSPPSSWQNLIAMGWLQGAPLDPAGEPYELQPGGRVVVHDVSKFPFIEHGIPEGENRSEFIGPAADKVLEKPGLAPK